MFDENQFPFDKNTKEITTTSPELGGVCFFYLMLNRTFFELNTE